MSEAEDKREYSKERQENPNNKNENRIYLEAGGSVKSLDALTVELPEDIARLKAMGHLKLAKRHRKKQFPFRAL